MQARADELLTASGTAETQQSSGDVGAAPFFHLSHVRSLSVT
jgi:hypothetical protein